MATYKHILLVTKEGKGGVINHPEGLEWPEKKKMGPRWYFPTDRWRTIPTGERARVYTEQGFSLNLDDFADPVTEEDKNESMGMTAQALTDLDEIFGEGSVFTEAVIEWHNKYLGQRLSE